MSSLKKLSIILYLLLFCPNPTFASTPYDQIAQNITRLAEHTKNRRVAVLPFAPMQGDDAQSGMALAERIISRLVSVGRLQVVERALLKHVLEEQGLENHGLVNTRDATQVGRILGVDAIITGTFLPISNGRLEVNARLIDAETARILGAATVMVDREWEGPSLFSSNDWIVPAPNLNSFNAPSVRIEPDPFRDAPQDNVLCEDWETRVDQVQSSLVEFKARYWAARLREAGNPAARLTRNPGSEFRSLVLKQEFYQRTKELFDAGYTAGVSSAEKELIERGDRKADRITENCDR